MLPAVSTLMPSGTPGSGPARSAKTRLVSLPIVPLGSMSCVPECAGRVRLFVWMAGHSPAGMRGGVGLARLGPRVLIDDPVDGATADAAEADRVAGEHDAVGLGPVQAL